MATPSKARGVREGEGVIGHYEIPGDGPWLLTKEQAYDLFAKVWDAAIDSLTYESGEKVEIVSNTNPYRIEKADA